MATDHDNRQSNENSHSKKVLVNFSFGAQRPSKTYNQGFQFKLHTTDLNQFSAFILQSFPRQIVARLSPIWFLYDISRHKSASLKSLKIEELRLFDKRS